MRIRSAVPSLIYKSLYLLAALAGLVLHSGALKGEFRANMFVYFTNLSNLLCLLFFAVLLVITARHPRRPYPFALVQMKGMVTILILVTFIVYHFILRPLITANLGQLSSGLSEFGNVNTPDNLLVHYVVPLTTLADWLLFDEKGRYRLSSPLVWTLGLVAYIIFVDLNARFAGEITGTGSRFPYPFMDVDVLGWPAVLLNYAIFILATAALGYLYLGLDRLLARLGRGGAARTPQGQ